MENNNTITVEILKSNKAEFYNRLKNIQKRISLEIIDEREVTRTFPFGNDNDITLDCIEYTLVGDRVDQIKGFSYIGSLTADGEAKVYYSHNEDENVKDIIESSLEFPCYHCNRVMSNRKSRLVFKKEDTQEIVSFGSTCCADYFGQSVIKKLEKSLTYINQLMGDCEDMMREGMGRIRDNYGHYNEFMNVAIHHFIHDGFFRSQAKSDDFNPSTTATLSGYISSPYDKPEVIEMIENWLSENALPEGTTVVSEIEKIQEYYQATVPTNDFEENMKQQVCNIGSKIGIICYAVFNYYKKTMHNDKEKKAQDGFKESIHYPVDKTKVEDEIVTVVSQRSYESDWGTGHVTTMRNEQYTFTTFGKITLKDKDGNYIIEEGELEKGQQIKIVKATIKDRTEYRGRKQTVINRIKIGLV